MQCRYPNCECRIDLPHGQLYPQPRQCPNSEGSQADARLERLKEDLFELLQREPYVWKDCQRVFALEIQFDRFSRLLMFAQHQIKHRRHADT